MLDSSRKPFYTRFVPFAFGFLQLLWSLQSYWKFSLSWWSSRYFDDVLLVVPSLEDLLVARDTLIFILQHLGFLVNIKKSYLKPMLTLEFLGKIVDFGGNYSDLSWRESPQNVKSIPGNPRKEERYSEETKQIDWEVIIHSNSSSCSNSPLLSCSTSADLELICHNSFKEKRTNIVEAKKEL